VLNLKVEGITCGGCAASIRRALAVAAPGADVTVDIPHGAVKIIGNADRSKVVAAIEQSGFDVIGDVA
jgi:copper chaperone